MAADWKALDEESKKKYTSLADADKQRYLKEKAEYSVKKTEE